jgi:hypothetical protein
MRLGPLGVPPKPTPDPGPGQFPPPSLAAWLDDHPNVRDALNWEDTRVGNQPQVRKPYPQWTDLQKAGLTHQFEKVWNNETSTLEVDPVPNEIKPLLHDHPTTLLSQPRAWFLYTNLVCHSLKAEIKGTLPWKLVDYSAELLADILNSGSLWLFQPPVSMTVGDPGQQETKVVDGYLVNAWTLPAHGRVVQDFLAKENIVASTRTATINNLLNWCGKNTLHFIGDVSTESMMANWQYRGYQPVSRVIEGTIADSDPAKTKKHWVRGCGGTAGFLKHVLRVVNIPVHMPIACDHAQVFFPTEGKYLAHGDDALIIGEKPGVTPDQILISQSQYDALFGSSVSEADKCTNINSTQKKLNP